MGGVGHYRFPIKEIQQVLNQQVMVTLIVLIVLLVTSLVVGFSGFLEIDFIIEVKRLSNPYYSIGMSFNEVPSQEEHVDVEELIIGLFLINIVLIFYKEKN